MTAPDEEILNRIAKKLKDQKILSDKQVDTFKKLAGSGKMTAEEWKFLLEPPAKKKP